jgi:RNA polymerase sigma-70 factor (ECF subfamily)
VEQERPRCRLADDVVVAEPVTDSALVARCAQGDESALSALYDRYSSLAYGLALRIVRDATLAEDVVQEAFLGLWRGAARFDAARSKVSTWLLSMVHHKAVDAVRREEARPKTASEQAPERADDADVARDVLRADDASTVRRALAQLTPPQRQVLELAYFGGLSQSELADRLGEPLGTIKSRTHAALARLRELLEGAGVS